MVVHLMNLQEKKNSITTMPLQPRTYIGITTSKEKTLCNFDDKKKCLNAIGSVVWSKM